MPITLERLLLVFLGCCFLLLCLLAGAIAAPIPANVFQYTPVNPTGPTTTTTTMMGIGITSSFTPHYDGVALIVITGNASNNLVSDGIQVQIQYGTGTAPSNAGTLAGLTCGNPQKPTNGSLTGNISNVFPFALVCVATGLTLNTGYWIDLAAAQVGAGTATLTGISVTAVEQ